MATAVLEDTHAKLDQIRAEVQGGRQLIAFKIANGDDVPNGEIVEAFGGDLDLLETMVERLKSRYTAADDIERADKMAPAIATAKAAIQKARAEDEKLAKRIEKVVLASQQKIDRAVQEARDLAEEQRQLRSIATETLMTTYDPDIGRQVTEKATERREVEGSYQRTRATIDEHKRRLAELQASRPSGHDSYQALKAKVTETEESIVSAEQRLPGLQERMAAIQAEIDELDRSRLDPNCVSWEVATDE